MHLTGRAFITMKGKRLRTREGATLKFGGLAREGQTADTGVAGYSEKVVIPRVECTIIHAADVSLKEIADINDETISFDTDTGRSFVLTGSWCADAPELSKGDVKTAFEAIKCEEV